MTAKAASDPPAASGTVTVAADANVIWRRITDLDGIGSRNPETRSARWKRGGGPRSGAKFRGNNRNGIFRWSTTCRVTDCRPGETFAFHVTMLGLPIADWRYDLHADPTNGCTVTESTWDRRGRLIRTVAPLATGVQDRPGQNQRNIDETLKRLKNELTVE